METGFTTNVCKFDLFTKCASLFQLFVFSLAKLTIKFSIIYDNAKIKDCGHKQGSAYIHPVVLMVPCILFCSSVTITSL